MRPKKIRFTGSEKQKNIDYGKAIKSLHEILHDTILQKCTAAHSEIVECELREALCYIGIDPDTVDPCKLHIEIYDDGIEKYYYLSS